MDFFQRCVASLSAEAGSLLTGAGVRDPTTLWHLLDSEEGASDLVRDYYPRLYEADLVRIAGELWELRGRTEWAARRRAREIAAADGPTLAVHDHEAKKARTDCGDGGDAVAVASRTSVGVSDPAWPVEIRRLEDVSGRAVAEKQRALRDKRGSARSRYRG